MRVVMMMGLVAVAAAMSLPPFDWGVAVRVALVVTVAAVMVVGLAIATPGVAMVAGGSLVGTFASIGAVSMLVGVVGGASAGFYWGREGEIERRETIAEVASMSRQLRIEFVPRDDDPNRAAPFECTFVTYDEIDLTDWPPRVDQRRVHVRGAGSEEFYALVQQRLAAWFARDVLADRDGSDRMVTVHMRPYPGDGVYERIMQMVQRAAGPDGGNRPVQTSRVNSSVDSKVDSGAKPNPSPADPRWGMAS